MLLVQNKIQISKTICSGLNQENISSTSSVNTSTKNFLSIDTSRGFLFHNLTNCNVTLILIIAKINRLKKMCYCVANE
jgi:hypothetical protein